MRLIDADKIDYTDTGTYIGCGLYITRDDQKIVTKLEIDEMETIDAIPISFILEEEQKLRNKNKERDIPLTTPIIEVNTLEALMEAWRNRNDS